MLNKQYRDALLSSELGKQLDEAELEIFLNYSKAMKFSKGEVILKQGTFANGMYLILNGSVKVTSRLLGAGTVDIETLGAGSIVGEISFIEKVPTAATVNVITDVQCLLISSIFFDVLTEYYPQTKYKLLAMVSMQVCGRLKKINDKIADIITKSDMTPRSFFSSVVIESLTKPEEITFEQSGMDRRQFDLLPIFKLFTAGEMEALGKHTTLLKAAKNCRLIHEGEGKPSCYIVIRGAVQSAIIKDNKIAKLSVISPSTLFAGVSCIVDDPAFTISFQTCERSILLKISDADCDFFQKNLPLLWYKLFSLIARSLVVLEKSLDKLDIRLNIERYNKVQ